MPQPPLERAAREYPDRPWVGVGAVVWRGEEVLLVRRGKPPRMGQWSLPGGAQAVGESVFETAVREVREETGLAIVPTGIVTVVDSITRDEADRVQYHYTLVEVGAECAGGEPVPGDDVVEARWMSVEEAERLSDWTVTLDVIRESAARRGR